MKKMAVMAFAVVASALGFSSCLDSDDSNPYGGGNSLVTVRGSAATGLRLYADYGGILIPSSENVSSMGATLEKLERVYIEYEFTEDISTITPSETATYNVNILGGYSYSVETKDVIDLYDNPEAQDSLSTHQDGITSLAIASAYRGYITVYPTYKRSRSQNPYFDMAFDSTTDVDVANNRLNMTLYFDDNTSDAATSYAWYQSFSLPSETYDVFTSDSLTLAVKALSDGGSSLEQTIRISRRDLLPLSAY